MVQSQVRVLWVLWPAKKHSYFDFFLQEIENRKILDNPPYNRIGLVKISSDKEESATKGAILLGKFFQQVSKKHQPSQVLGPVESVFYKIKNRFFWQILIKSPRHSIIKKLIELFQKERRTLPASLKLQVTIDIDPYFYCKD